MKNIKRIITVMMVLSLAVLVTGLVYAQEDAKPAKDPAVSQDDAGAAKEKTKGASKVNRKSIEGEISGVGNNYIGIIYKTDESIGREYELAIPIEGRPELQHIVDIRQLNAGDIVAVYYDETVELQDDGKESVVGRNAKIIKFIKAAPKAAPEPVEESVEAEE